MTILTLAALVWVGVHVGLAGTGLRGAMVRRLGEHRFLGLFSAISIVALVLLVWAYGRAATTPFWFAPAWLRWVLVALMLPACILVVAAYTRPNPTAVGQKPYVNREPQGIQRITRHPMMAGVSLWALVHMIGNGDSASLVFFGAFLATAALGMPSIDAKLARRDPAGWQALAERTSILPFGAILAGRNRFEPQEIGWLAPLLGLLLWAGLLHFHQWLFGVAPVGLSVAMG
jgi:uncharacterized membrane protein